LFSPRSNVYIATADPQDADAVQRGCGMLAGVAMVALQCMVVHAVLIGTAWPVCGTSDQCHQVGTFCAVGQGDRCTYCGDTTPLPDQTDLATGGTLNDPEALDFAGFNHTAVAELCADPHVSPGPVPDRASIPLVIARWNSSNDALAIYSLHLS
jgi:hypothetical protein